MSDRISSRQAQELPNASPDGPPSVPTGEPSGHNEHAPEEPARDNLSIFDERSALFTDQFGRTCAEQGVQLALAVVLDPQHPGRPHIFYRGHIYDVAMLTKEVLSHLVDQIVENLRV